MTLAKRPRWPLHALAVAVTLSLTACGGSARLNIPTPLDAVDKRLSVDQSWSRDTGKGVGKFHLDLQPFADDDAVFVAANNGQVSAYALASGDSKWQVDTAKAITAGVNGGSAGIAVGAEDGAVLMLSRHSGETLWSQNLTSQVTAISAELDGVIVARTGDGYIYGLSALTGTVAWKQLRKTPALSLQSQSEPLVARGAAFVGLDDGQLLMLSISDGRVLFEKPVAQGRGRTEIDRLVDIDGNLALDGNVVYAASYQGSVVAIDAARGQQLWQESASAVHGIAADSRSIYLADENSVVWARDKHSGAALWKQDKLKFRQLTAPVIFGHHVVVADYEGYVHWLDPESGQIVDRRRGDSKGVLAAPIVAGEKLLVLGKSGELNVFSQ